MSKLRLAGLAFGLWFSNWLACADMGPPPDILSVKSVELRSVGNHLNGDLYDYLFITDRGCGLEIRPVGDQWYVAVADRFDAHSFGKVDWPYRAVTLGRQGKGEKRFWFLWRRVYENSAKLPRDDPRLPLLRHLLNHAMGLDEPAPKSRSGFGRRFGDGQNSGRGDVPAAECPG